MMMVAQEGIEWLRTGGARDRWPRWRQADLCDGRPETISARTRGSFTAAPTG